MKHFKKIISLTLIVAMVMISGLQTITVSANPSYNHDNCVEYCTDYDCVILCPDYDCLTHCSDEHLNCCLNCDLEYCEGAIICEESAEINEIVLEEIDVEDYQLLEFLIVDLPVLYTPETQYIAIGLIEEVEISNATLYLFSETLQDYIIVEAENLYNNSVLFTINHEVGSTLGNFLLNRLYYEIVDNEEVFYLYFNELNINAYYEVKIQEEPDFDFAIYGIDEDGELVYDYVLLDELDEAIGNILYEIDEEVESIDETFFAEHLLLPNALIQTRAEEGFITPNGFQDILATGAGIQPTAAGIQPTSAGNRIIVVSAGHCATHRGAAGNGLLEHELTWDVARATVAELNRFNGITAFMDRPTINCAFPGSSWQHCVTQRIHDARRVRGATVFVDIHFNAFTNAQANGVEIWISSNAFTAAHNEGRRVSTPVLNNLVALGFTNRGLRWNAPGNEFASNRVARELGMTGILVEGGFITNAADANRVRTAAQRQNMGVQIARGLASAYGATLPPQQPPQPPPQPPVVPPANPPAVVIDNRDCFVGTARINVSNLGTADHVLIWSNQSNGSNQRRFNRDANGRAVINFNINQYNNHRGQYTLQVRRRNANGTYTTVLNQAFFKTANLTTTTTVVNRNNADTHYDLTFRPTLTPFGITEVRFAVWSVTDGQNDLIWYNGVRQADGRWTATALINSHAARAPGGIAYSGNYTVHTWIRTVGGGNMHSSSATFNVTAMSGGTVTVDNINQTAGTFGVVIRGVNSRSGVNRVLLPVWTQNNQSDIRWLSTTRQADGSFRGTVRVADFTGSNFQIHAHVFGNNGLRRVISTTHTFQRVVPTVSVVNRNNQERFFDLTLNNANALGNLRNVQFAVWGELNGQNDLVWYNGTANGNTFRATADITRHREAGRYHVHVWATLPNGTRSHIASGNFNVTNISVPSITVGMRDRNTGEFHVVFRNVTQPSGINRIQVPVWSGANQSNIIWYNAVLLADGSWRVIVDPRRHANHNGVFQIQGHIHANNGLTRTTSTTATLNNIPLRP